MTGAVFRVAPRSRSDIRHTATRVRQELHLVDVPYFPIIHVIDQILCSHFQEIELEVEPLSEMAGAEGYTCPNGTFITLREDVYDGAIAGEGRHRFTAAHELGHLLLHSGRGFARVPASNAIRPFENSEWQADTFAAELLMPARFFSSSDTVQVVVDRHGVSYQAADYRLVKLRQEGLI